MPLSHPTIHRLRLKAKLTQVEAARRAEMGQPHWHRLESGRMPDPKLSTLEKVAKALRCTVNDLLE